jgi:ribosomal protein S18 acetylase RimI-like enzyme
MERSIQLKNISTNEAKSAAEIHLSSFPGFFLTRLGISFLHLFYTSLLKDSFSTLVGAYEGDKLIGFVCFTIKPRGIYSRIVRIKLFGFVGWLTTIIMTRPTIINEVWNLYRYNTGFTTPDEYSALLMSICVLPECKSRGLGAALIDAAENTMRKRNVSGYYLTTDAVDNERVNNFYRGKNLELYCSFMQGSREMNVYTKNIS